MYKSITKKPATLLTLLMLALASYFVIYGQQVTQPSISYSDNKQEKPAIRKEVSVHPVNEAYQPHLSGKTSPRQSVAVQELTPQDWLTDFKNSYPADDNAVRKLMTEINAELHPEFIEQLLRQVLFLPDGDPVRVALENLLIMKLANLDPPRAADYVLATLAQQKQPANLNPSQPDGYQGFALPPFNMPAQQFFMGHQLISSLMQSWGEKDLPQAIAWTLAIGDEQIKHEALNLLSYTRDEHKIDLIADEVSLLPEGNVRSGLLTQLAEQKAQIDPDAAVAWVSNWPDTPERNKAISALIGVRTSQSLEDTATLVEQALAAGMTPDETATDMLINQWQYKSPDQAYQWASNLPESTVKSRALMLLDAMREAATQE